MAKFILSAFADEASGTVEGQISALKRNGIYYLEPRDLDGSVVKKTDKELFQIHNILEQNGIGISAIGSPVGKIDIDEPFEKHLPVFRRALAAAKILGTNKIRIFSFFVKPEELAIKRTEVLRRLKIMLNEAENEGIILCHENESRIYGQDPAEVYDLMSSLPGLRGVFDAANFVREGLDPMEGFEATLPSLEYIHIKDAKASGERPIMPVGLGDGKYEGILTRVDAETDRKVFLTLEPHLRIFKMYQKIDSHKLATEMKFDTSDEAFDCAADYLKQHYRHLNNTYFQNVSEN